VKLKRAREALESLKQATRGDRPLDLRASAVDAIRFLANSDAQAWADLWADIWHEDPENQTPLRLLRVAADYRRNEDKTVLLSLPAEERKILLPLLNLDENDLETI